MRVYCKSQNNNDNDNDYNNDKMTTEWPQNDSNNNDRNKI